MLKKYGGTYEPKQVAFVLRGLTFAFLAYLKERNAGILNDVVEYLDFNISKLSPNRLAESYDALVNLKRALNEGEHEAFSLAIKTVSNNELATLTRHNQFLKGHLPPINTNKELLASMMLRQSQIPTIQSSMMLYYGERNTYSAAQLEQDENEPHKAYHAQFFTKLTKELKKNLKEEKLNFFEKENEQNNLQFSILADKLENQNFDDQFYSDSEEENEQNDLLLPETQVQKKPEQWLAEFTKFFNEDYNSGLSGGFYSYLPNVVQTGIYTALNSGKMSWADVLAHGAEESGNERTVRTLKKMGVLPLENAVSNQPVFK